MAEEEFEEDFDDLADDDIDDIGFDEDEIPDEEAEEAPKEEAGQPGSSQGRFAALRELISTKRNLVLGIVLGVVFLVSAGLFAMRLFSDKPDQPKVIQNTTTKIATSDTGKETVEKKKKKKKKKIKYVKLYDLERDSITDVLRELAYADITFKSEQRGKTFTVSVDEDELADALNVLAMKGLPASDKQGYALLDDAATLGVTEFDKKIRYVRALSGELEKAIIKIDAIDDAKVQVVLPKERLFSVTQPPVTAAVIIRKRLNYEMTDDIVYGIIQIVANAVENLQQENVSVIDTEGMVLSNGIFERMALREAGIAPEEPVDLLDPVEEVPEPSPLLGNPIEPNFADVSQWFAFKKDYEENLEKKVVQQLRGILPAGSYKVAITTELGPLSNEDVVDVRLLTASIVVDRNNEDVFLTPQFKQQIFSTVAGTVGYVRGRDTIQLSLADFNLFTEEELKKLQEQSQFLASLDKQSINKFIVYPMIPIVIGGVGYLGYRFYKRRKDRKEAPDPEFDDVQEELETEKRWDEIRDFSAENPERIASIMEQWLNPAEV